MSKDELVVTKKSDKKGTLIKNNKGNVSMEIAV
jgi:hypothetical protein